MFLNKQGDLMGIAGIKGMQKVTCNIHPLDACSKLSNAMGPRKD